jgi:hypothetical protein
MNSKQILNKLFEQVAVDWQTISAGLAKGGWQAVTGVDNRRYFELENRPDISMEVFQKGNMLHAYVWSNNPQLNQRFKESHLRDIKVLVDPEAGEAIASMASEQLREEAGIDL